MLGTFTPPQTGKAGSFDPRQNVGKPLIVVPREFREGFTTKRFPNPRDVVIVDVVDLSTAITPAGVNLEAATIHISVIWGAAAIVDRLRPYATNPENVNQPLPVVIAARVGQTGNNYTTVEPLEGNALRLAEAWDAQFGMAKIDAVRAEKQAADAQQQTSQVQAGQLPALGFNQAPAPQPVQAPTPVAQVPAQQSAPAQQQPAQTPYSDEELAQALASLG